MRWLGWLLQLWHRLEPAERLDWILDTLGLRERIHQLVIAIVLGIAMLIYQYFENTPIEWKFIMALGSVGLSFFLLNQWKQ